MPDPNETFGPGQLTEIDRVYAAYPHLNDDAFVAQHRDDWLRLRLRCLHRARRLFCDPWRRRGSRAKPTKQHRKHPLRRATLGKPSALLDTRVIYRCVHWGDNVEQLAKLPDGCVDLI